MRAKQDWQSQPRVQGQMTTANNPADSQKEGARAAAHDDVRDNARENAQGDEPDWADGLRQLYNSVVEEPLPDSFKELLSKLDEDGKSA